MARRWLLTVLTGTALSFGLAGTASAQELPDDPVAVDAGAASVSADADTTGRSLEVEVTTDAEAEALDTVVSPDVTATVSPDGADADAEGPVEVAGNELTQAAEPVGDATDGTGTAPGQTAAGSDVTPAAAPAAAATAAGPAPVGDADTGTTAHSRTISADRAEARGGLFADTTTYTYDDSELAPEVAPPADDELPLVAAAAPVVATDLSLPIIDTTPTVPALLRLLAGLLVVGAAATWQTVRNELA